MLVALVLTVVAALSIGASAALAHGGPGFRLGGTSNALLADAAKRLGVTQDQLEKAITDAAVTRINEAVEDGDIDADDAQDLKDEVADDNIHLAISLSRTRTVAANLDKTAAQLNTAFREARKAQIVARIDEAVEDGDLEADEAKELKADLDEVRLPGYKPFSLGFGFGRGFGFGPGFGHKHGFGR
jgi:polyhydroxyalkanoate synthesis regulator phasin